MPNKILGTPGAIKQPNRYRGGPGIPSSTIMSWKGPRTAIEAMIAQAVNAGYEWELTPGPGPNATIEMIATSLPGGGGTPVETPVDTWELLPGSAEKELLESEFIMQFGETQIELLRQAFNNIQTQVPQAPAGMTPASIEIYRLMVRGVRAIKISIATLRHTRTVSASWQIDQANANIEKLIKTDTLKAQETGIPGNLLVLLNADPFNKTWTLNPPNPSAPNLVYSWYKNKPHLTATYGSRSQLVQEWEWGLWATGLYGAAI